MRLLELQHHPHRRRLRGHGYFKRLGPGIVTGAADDDPSGIGTYSQVGAAFGFGLLVVGFEFEYANTVEDSVEGLPDYSD